MSFSSIVALVLAAVIILALLFVFFHVFIALIPVAIIAIIILWLIRRFSKKSDNETPATGFESFDWFNNSESQQNRPRKKAQNVTTKDIDDKK